MTLLYLASASYGVYSAPALGRDFILLKKQFFTGSGTNQRNEESFQYAYRQNHPLLQFLPLKLAEWMAKNLAEEKNPVMSGVLKN
jgi:hypothetical protein